MTAAVIDLGTNTFHLIIADLSGPEMQVIYKTNLPVKLGEGRINENVIIPQAFERGIAALKCFKEEIDRHNVDVVKAIATSAIRSADNGEDFVRASSARAGIDITVITGEEEANFIYQGVKATGVIQSSSLIMDIGGGSTEFIICNAQELLWKKSYNIGAARLQQAYFKSDPISTKEQQAIKMRLQEELTDLYAACKKYGPKQLIGSAGAFETFAAMLDPGLDIATLKWAGINVTAFTELSLRLIHSTHKEREKLKGLIPLRVDMIVIASLLTNYIIEVAGTDTLSLSTYDLKMGVLYNLVTSNTQ